MSARPPDGGLAADRPPPPAAVRIVPIGYRNLPPWITALTPCLQRTFGGSVVVAAAPFAFDAAWDPQRGQYNALVLLEALLDLPGSERLLGLVARDLFIPMLTHVFGQAQLNGRGAVLSTYRLDNRVYGLAPDEPLFAERVAKEAVHELGHAFGLVHCRDPGCVMHSSTFVEEIDLKGATFCIACRQRSTGAGM